MPLQFTEQGPSAQTICMVMQAEIPLQSTSQRIPAGQLSWLTMQEEIPLQSTLQVLPSQPPVQAAGQALGSVRGGSSPHSGGLLSCWLELSSEASLSSVFPLSSVFLLSSVFSPS